MIEKGETVLIIPRGIIIDSTNSIKIIIAESIILSAPKERPIR